MTLKQRIEELERRVATLEQRPIYVSYPPCPPYTPNPNPPNPIYPPPFFCQTGMESKEGE